MKLKLLFKSGKTMIVEDVLGFAEIKEQTNSGRKKLQQIEQYPAEGILFEVNPLGIDRRRFKNPRRNPMQEKTRKIILEAFDEVDKNPKKYSEPFYTLIPEKSWSGYKTRDELKQYAKDLGGQMADWVHQALEWAQRICNGEEWEDICNKCDTAKYYRMIEWKDGKCRVVGGMSTNCCNHPASEVDFIVYENVETYLYVVPLVVLKNKKDY